MSKVERMFGPKEDWGKPGEMDRVREQAGKKADKPAEDAGKPAPVVKTGAERGRNRKVAKRKGTANGVKGFVHIRCAGCGKAISTCLHEEREIFCCKKCGHPNPLEKLTNIHFKCPGCGFKGRYRTNRTEAGIQMECLQCSRPVDLDRNGRGDYVTVEE